MDPMRRRQVTVGCRTDRNRQAIRSWLRWVLPLVFLAVARGPLAAQDLSARAYLTPAAVGVGQVFVLNVEVTGAQGVDRDPELPAMDAFARFLGAGTSTNMQTVNGRMAVSFTIQYRFQATTEGTHSIGAISVESGGETLSTEPVSLTISTSPPHGAPQEEQEPGVGPEDLFLTVEASKRRVVVNEPVVVEYRLFTRVNVESYSLTSVPSSAGFWVEEPNAGESPQVEQVTRDGQQYATAVVRRIIMFPTAPGERTLEPLDIEAQVRVQGRRSGDPFQDFFNRSSVFGSRMPMTVTAPAVSITVDPVPADGQPAGFSGHVGTLALEASLDRPEVEAGDAVTYTIRASGEGNLRVLPTPEVSFPPELESFPPESSSDIRTSATSVSGSREFSYVLIPRVGGEITLPAVSIPYYDVARGTYGVAETAPLSISVTGGEAPAPTGVAGTAPAGVESIREDIRFILPELTRLSPIGGSPYTAPWFFALMGLPLVGILGALVLRRHWDRLEGDVAYARTRRAHKAARRRLSQAEKAQDKGARAFYGEVSGALRGFLADKLNLSASNLDAKEAERLAQAKGASSESLGRFFELLEQCDFQRFRPPGDSDPSTGEVLDRATDVMAALARELK